MRLNNEVIQCGINGWGLAACLKHWSMPTAICWCRVPHTRTRLGDRSFLVVGPRLWSCDTHTLKWDSLNGLNSKQRRFCLSETTVLSDLFVYVRLRSQLTHLLYLFKCY